MIETPRSPRRRSGRRVPASHRRSDSPTSIPLQQAVAYARVSSKEQEKEGFSIPAQEKLYRAYSADHGFTIVREFVDIETAKRPGRSDFDALLTYLRRNRRVRILLVEKTDRLYRNLKDWVSIDDLEIEVHFVKENVVLSPGSRSTESSTLLFRFPNPAQTGFLAPLAPPSPPIIGSSRPTCSSKSPLLPGQHLLSPL